MGFGFLSNPFYPNFVKKLQVQKLDYRIHFALNCGAISCPPIFFYNYEIIDNQLNIATNSFIHLETSIEVKSLAIHTTKLFLWYRRDFGTIKKIKQIIGTVFNQDLSNYKLKFKPYNWEKQLNNFN